MMAERRKNKPAVYAVMHILSDDAAMVIDADGRDDAARIARETAERHPGESVAVVRVLRTYRAVEIPATIRVVAG